MNTNATNVKVDIRYGINIDNNRISNEGDLTHAIIAVIARYNSEKQQTEVLLIDYFGAGQIQKRTLAGSGEQLETVEQTLKRKINFLSGLMPEKWVYISEKTGPTSSKDVQRLNEEHTKYGCVITEFSGTLIEKVPVTAETGIPQWYPAKKLPVIFKPHYEHIENALAFLKYNYKDIYKDL